MKYLQNRFIPNVKFTVPNELVDCFKNLIIETLENKTGFHNKHSLDSFHITNDMYFYYNDTRNVFMSYPDSDAHFFDWEKFKEVSIYEAISEFIPEGMRYNKELDKLVPDIMQWKKADNGGNHIAVDGTSFDTIEEALNHNCTLVSTSSADEYCSGIKVEQEPVKSYVKKTENPRDYNIGSSNYASMKIQPWDVWKDWKLDPWDADIIKRISRTKEIPGKSFEDARIEDYEKIKHICDEKIYQLKEKNKC